MYTGEEKGGLDPEEEVALLRRPLPLNTYITYIPNSTTRFNESLDILNIPITLTLTNKPSMTAPKQHKQRYYYIFWGIATLCVVIGQINIISTYNRLSNNLELLIIEQVRTKTSEAAN